MTHKQFFAALRKLYSLKEYPVKYWLQCTTFSFAIYHADDAFHGKSMFDSTVYYFWDGIQANGESTMALIIKDIEKEREKIITKDKQTAEQGNIEL